MNLINKQRLLGLLQEYAKEKCKNQSGEGDGCPFNDGDTEGMHWCAFDTIFEQLGEETGQGNKVSEDFDNFKTQLESRG
jgi:hypothetical protein